MFRYSFSCFVLNCKFICVFVPRSLPGTCRLCYFYRPAHAIRVLITYLLSLLMSCQAELDDCIFGSAFINFLTLLLRTAMTLTSLRGRAGSS